MENSVKGWRYYNHAVITTTAPHEDPILKPLKDGSIWNIKSSTGKKPLLARYTTDFDCGIETGFWFIIKESPFNIEDLTKKYKKHVLKALERCNVKRIDVVLEFESVYEVYKAAFNTYKNADNEMSKEDFRAFVQNDGLEYWGAFDKESGKMAGWMSCRNNDNWTETISAKYHPDLQSFVRPSDAIHYTILNYYLNELGHKYICSGSRNVNHETNVQDYKITNWKFRQAYCKLHIEYRKGISIIVKLIYPFRHFFKRIDNITFIHQINSLLRMEEIARNCY